MCSNRTNVHVTLPSYNDQVISKITNLELVSKLILNDRFDQFLYIHDRLTTVEETMEMERLSIVYYQNKLKDPYKSYIYGYSDPLILDHLLNHIRFTVREKQNIFQILQGQRNRLKEKFDDLLIQILLTK